MLFYTPSCAYLVKNIAMKHGSCTFHQFSDGEWQVTVHDDVQDKTVWVLAATAPADTIVQLLLLLDALQRAGATVKLMITYFGYARQDVVLPGQALSSEVMCKLLGIFSPVQINVIQLHNPGICQFMVLKNHIPYDFFYAHASEVDTIVAPDKGAETFARHIANHTHKNCVLLQKHRPEPEKVVVRLSGEVSGTRALIVDDMISTGNTIIQAAQLLRDHGVMHVTVAATHGVFSGDAVQRLEASSIEKISITNTLPHKALPKKITIYDIAPFLTTLMCE